MSLYLDSAVVEDVERALEYGVVAGVTTNPTLVAEALARRGRPCPARSRATAQPRSEEELYRSILERLGQGQRLYVQVDGDSPAAIVRDAERWWALAPGRIVAKIPATWQGIGAIPLLKQKIGIPVCVTAVFSPAQAYVAALAGAGQIAVYVNRYARARGDAKPWLSCMRATLTRAGGNVRILAASLKTSAEAGDALVHGADDLTVPASLLHALLDDPLTADALQRFALDLRRVRAQGPAEDAASTL